MLSGLYDIRRGFIAPPPLHRISNTFLLISSKLQVLRQHLPPVRYGTKGKIKSKKLSKVQTLRSAIEYIHYLQDAIQSTGDLSQDVSKVTGSKVTGSKVTGSLPQDVCVDIGTHQTHQTSLRQSKWSPEEHQTKKERLSCELRQEDSSQSCSSVDAVPPQYGNSFTGLGLRCRSRSTCSDTSSQVVSLSEVDSVTSQPAVTTSDEEVVSFDSWF